MEGVIMIHIENLVKRYGDLVALNHLNLDIHEGEIFGLLGPNGFLENNRDQLSPLSFKI